MTNPLNAPEEDYFRREEAERRRQDDWDSLQKNASAMRAESARLTAAQLKRCPKCRIALEPRTLRSVEIDVCSMCKGIWLDEGELEQLTQHGRGLVERMLAPFRSSADKSDFG